MLDQYTPKAMFIFGDCNISPPHVCLLFQFTIQLGLCIPQSCSTDDLKPLLEDYINHRYLTVQNLYNLDLNLTMIRSLEPVGLWLVKIPKTIILL